MTKRSWKIEYPSNEIISYWIHQQTVQVVRSFLHKITIFTVPGETSSRVEPLDAFINKLLTIHVRASFKKHLNENLAPYTESKLTISDLCILTIKQVGKILRLFIIKAEKKVIWGSLVKFVLSNNLDGSENHLVDVRGL